ncbi:MAG: hypothetical protein RIS24_1226 [Verrucomicrobiota bacterium]
MIQGQALGTGCVVGRTRGHGPGVGLRGPGPALAGRRRKARVFALRARGLGCLPSMLAPARSRWRCEGAWGCLHQGTRIRGQALETGLCLGTGSEETLWAGYGGRHWGQAAYGSGDRLCCGADSWARAWGRLARARACARRKAQEGVSFRAAREGIGVFAFNTRSGPIPLAL